MLPFLSNAQLITEYAGCASCAPVLGDGGPATAAYIDDPCGCTFSKNGVFFVASGAANRIRRIDTNGIITTIAGTGFGGYSGDGGQATSARFHSLEDITLDTAGNIFVVDVYNFAIRRIDIITGIINTICGNGTSGSIGDGGPASAAQITNVNEICFDKHGNLYLAELDNPKIRKINTSGIISTFAGTGVAGYNGDGIAATAAQLYGPTGVTADDSGNIYIADGNSRVRKVNTAGIISTFAGNGLPTYIGDGIPATNAQIGASYLKFDSSHNLFIVDESTNLRVYKVDTSGILHCVAGNGIDVDTGDGGPATAAAIFTPCGIALDRCNNLYITLINYNRIRKVTFEPSCDPFSNFDSASLNVKTTTTNEVSIYPNPAYSSITITTSCGDSMGEVKIEGVVISNFIGQTVFSQIYDIEKAEVNIAGLPEGMYIVKIIGNDGKVIVRKIVKE